MGTYTIRDMDEKTKYIIHDYALQHHLNTSEALRNLILFGNKSKKGKKYKSFFEVYDKLKFKGEKNLSAKIDEAIYK